jgi:hypothetical protein
VEAKEILAKPSETGAVAAIAVAIASLLKEREEVSEARLEVVPSPERGLSTWAFWGRYWQLMRSRELRRGHR